MTWTPTPPPSSAFDALPLRERKAARTRLALLDAVLARLAEGPLSTVNVKRVCAEVGVSEPTYFNYFGSKAGALVFHVYLWSVEAQWRLARAESARAGLQELFDRTAEGLREVPWLMPEIIVWQIRAMGTTAAPSKPTLPPPTVADKLLRLPELEGVEQIQPLGVRQIFQVTLARAVAEGELPADTDLDLAERLLLSLFFGAAACQGPADRVADTLSRGLELTWRSLSEPHGPTT